ncbi:hypothetical protein JCM10212_003572 [Sporobolomyces blumeae]
MTRLILYDRFLVLVVVSLVSLASTVALASPLAAAVRGSLVLSNASLDLDHSTAYVSLSSLSSSDVLDLRSTLVPSHLASASEPRWSFTFSDVPRGEYRLKVESRNFDATSYFVKVSSSSSAELPSVEPEVALWDDKALEMIPGTWVPHPIMIHPTKAHPLLDDVPRPQTSLVSLLKSNPLVWLLAILVVLVVAMPKLINTLDPETLREVQESQKEMHKNMAVRF